MAFPPTVGATYKDPLSGRRWTVSAAVESGFREVQLVPFSGEGRTTAGFVVPEEEWQEFEDRLELEGV